MCDIRGRWTPVNPDCRGYADLFQCSICGCNVHLGTFEKDCDYYYCPWCGNVIDDTMEVVDNANDKGERSKWITTLE